MVRILFSALIMLLMISGCTSDPAEKLVRTAEKFKNGKIQEKEFIEFFIQYFKTGTITDGKYIFDDTAVYFRDENKIFIRLPWRCTIELDTKINNFTLNASQSLKRFSISHEKGFILYSDTGTLIAKFKVPSNEKKTSVRGAVPTDKGVIFYMNNNLCEYDLSTEKVSRLLKKKFQPVYEKYFDVKFIQSDGMLFMVSGSAGTYRISVYDPAAKKLLAENIAAASPQICINKNSINYIAGATGDWSVANFDYTTKKKKKINTLAELRGIAMFHNGYVYEDSKGISVSSYKNKPVKIPYEWRLYGKYGDTAVIKIDGRYVLADSSKLIDGFDLVSFLYETKK